MPRTLNISHTFEIPAFTWPDKRSSSPLKTWQLSSFVRGIGATASLFSGRTLKNAQRCIRLPEILYNSTNPMTTSKLLKCFHFCVSYASDVQAAVRGHDVWGWDYSSTDLKPAILSCLSYLSYVDSLSLVSLTNATGTIFHLFVVRMITFFKS